MELEFVIKAKYDELMQAQSRLEELTKQYDSLQKEFQSGHISTHSFSAFEKSIVDTFNQIGDASDKVSEKFISLGNSIGGGRLDTSAFERMSIALRQVMEDGTGSADAIQKITLAAQGVSAISEQIREQKAEVQNLSNTYNEQKSVIDDMKAAMDEYKIALEQANQAGDKQTASSLKEQITTLKSDLMVAKGELDGFAEAGAQAIEKLSGLESLMGSLAKAVPNFTDMTAGADTAQQKVSILSNSFSAFQSASEATSESIRRMSEESVNYSVTAEQLASAVANMTRDMNNVTGLEGDDQMTARYQAITQAVEQYGTAIANQTATAEMAFAQQKQYIASLEEEMARLQSLMSEAMSQGDVASSGALAQQMQTLAASINEAKNELAQLQQQAEAARESLANVGNAQADMLKAASRGDTFFGKIFDTIDALKEKVSDAMNSIKEKASDATSGIRARFSEAGNAISEKLGGVVDNIGFDRLSEKMSSISETISEGFGKSKESVSSFMEAIDGMGIPLSKTITGIKGMTAASLKFLATPLGLALGAIALALKSVWTFLTKSAEGQKVMAKGSAVLSSLMGTATDLLVLFGKTLYKIFTSGDAIITQFGQTLMDTFKTAFNAIRNILGGIGTMIQGAFSMDWDTFKAGFEQAGVGLVDAGKTIVGAVKTSVLGVGAAFETMKAVFTDKELASGITNILDSAWEKAQRASAMATEKMQNAVDKSNAQANFQVQQQTINEERNKIYSLEGKERLKQIQLVKKMQQEAYSPIIKQQEKELALLKEKNAMHTSTLEDLARERELRFEIARSEARQAASTRMMARLEASTQKSITKKAESDEKKKKSEAKKAESEARKATNKSNAVTSATTKRDELIYTNSEAQAKDLADVKSKIEIAKIAAMRDDYQRTKEEMDRRNREEIDQISRQMEAAVEAEKKRQKAEFKAEQDIIKAQGGKITAWDDSMYIQKGIDDVKSYYSELEKYTKQKQQRESVEALSAEYDKREADRQKRIAKLRIDIAELERALANAENIADRRQIQSMQKRAKSQLEWLENYKDVWDEYYTKYGTFTEKMKALDDKFANDTMGLSTDSPEYMAKSKERDKAKSNLIVQEVKAQTNWEQVFGDLSSVSRSALAVLEEQLTTLINNSKDLSIESIKELSTALDKVRAAQAQKGGLASAVTAFSGLRESRNKAKQAQDAVRSVQDQNGQTLFGRYTAKGVSVEDKAKIRESQVYDPVTRELTTFGKMLDRAAKAAKDLSTAQKNAQNSIKAVGGSLSTLGRIGNSTSDLLGRFGVNLADGFGNAFSGLSSIGEAMESFDISKPGSLLNMNNYAKFASGIVDTFTGMFEGITNLFGSSGMREYKNAKEERDKMTALWDDLIAKKKEYISISYGAEALKAANDVESLYKADLESLDRLGLAYIRKHAANAHTAAYRMNKDIGSEGFRQWSSVSGQSISTIQDFFDKDWTYDQLVAMKGADDGKIWANLTEEMQGYLDEMIQLKKGVEELGDTIKERLTGVSFDEFKNNFISAMRDMNSSATDMTNNFKQNLREAIIDTMIDKKFKDRLQKLYDDFASANEDGDITKAEYDRLIDEESKIAAEMQAEKRKLIDQYGFSTSETTSGSSRGFSAMTQDQASELNGRFTAMNESMNAMNGTLDNIHANVLASLDLQNNSLLELTAINRNTATSNEFLSTLSDEMVRIRKKMENL